jgi:hypothetical protein
MKFLLSLQSAKLNLFYPLNIVILFKYDYEKYENNLYIFSRVRVTKDGVLTVNWIS